MKIDADFIWKIVVAGDGGVGKSCILHRYIHNEFIDDMKMTIGAQFHTQLLERQQSPDGDVFKINLVLWDFSGQERFKFIFDDYCRGAGGAFVMFDMERIQTLYEVPKWVTMIRNNSKGDIPVVLIGGKLDLLSKERLDDVNAMANQMANDMGCIAYIPTSSKLPFNVTESITYMVDLLITQNA